MSKTSVVGVILGVAFIIALVIIGPFLVIWSLNTLFPSLVIPYALETWSAIMLLGGWLSGLMNTKIGKSST
jgi:hypothetical protein